MKSNVKKSIIFSLIVFIVLVFAIEKYLAYRNETIGKPKTKLRFISLRECQPFADIKYIPDDECLKATDSLIKKVYNIKVDENGFIEPSKIHENPDISIVFLGGSTTICRYVEEGNRFPYLTGRIIETKLNKKVNSYNNGVDGNNSMHSIDILLNKIIPIKPDIVVMGHNVNDIIILLYAGGYWNDYSRRLIVDIDDELPYIIFKKVKNSTVPNLYKAIRNNKIIKGAIKRISKVRNRNDEWAKIRGGKLKIDKEKLVNDFTSSLRTFVSICKTWNIKPVLITQANRLKENPDKVVLAQMEMMQKSVGMGYEQFKEIFDLFNEIIKKIAEENNILFIDLANEIPQEREYMYDVVHLNDNGSQFAANIISEELLKILDKE